jgi:hypothetical protein
MRKGVKQKCCDEDSCSQLVDDLQDLQFKCNDAFKNVGRNSLYLDEKGNIEGTACTLLKEKKNKILNRFNGAKLGGRKTRRQNKRQSKRLSKRLSKRQIKRHNGKTRGRGYKK